MPPNKAIEKLDWFVATNNPERVWMGTFSVIDPVEDWDPDAANSWLVKEAEDALELTRGLQSRKVAQDYNATWTACSIHMLNRNGAGMGRQRQKSPTPHHRSIQYRHSHRRVGRRDSCGMSMLFSRLNPEDRAKVPG